MRILYSKEFLRKANTKHYPLKGYYYQYVTESLSGVATESDWYKCWMFGKSSIYPCNTFISKEGCRISITTNNQIDRDNVTRYIYLFALDLTRYQDIETDFSGFDDPKWYSQLAAIIDLESNNSVSNVINKRVTNIYELEYIPKCSFITTAELGQVQVDHYNSNYMGQEIDSHVRNENEFIDKESGLATVREVLTYSNDEELLGSMTIRKSGLIQL